MTDDDVRDMLAERAGAIRPTDGLAKIEARLAGEPVATRRRLPMPMLAAAAVTVLALVGVTVFVQRDDETNVDSGAFTAAPTTPPGIWPWPGDTVVPGVQDDPVDAARAYVAAALPDAGELTDTGFNQPGVGSGAVTFTGAVSTTVYVQQGDDGWYVTVADSDLVTATIVDGGLIEYETTAPGELTKTVQEPGEPAHPLGPMVETPHGEGVGDRYALSTPTPLSRHRFVLRTEDGTIGLAELRYEQPDEDAATDTTQPTMTELPAGVWPVPQDDVDAAALDDPVDTARAYIDARVGGVTDRTRVSEYQAGDNSSGEVVFGGDISTTVFVRRLDGRWHVEGAASDLVTLHDDDDGDGSLTARIESKGFLQSHVVLSTGSSEPLVPAREYDAGEEITDGLAFDLNSDQVVKAVRFLLTSGPEGVKGLTEVAFRPPFRESNVPADALTAEGGLDAVEVAQRYLTDRLGGRTVTITGTDLDHEGYGDVTWEAGVVRLQRADGYWYVVEAIGDSVQINAALFQDGALHGEITVAEAGTLHVSTTDGSMDIPVDQDGEGTVVPFELETAVSSGPVRVVFETATGFVSLAERVYG